MGIPFPLTFAFIARKWRSFLIMKERLAPNPSWGLERMKPKTSVPEDVKSSGEEKAEEKRRKKADQAKGSSRDPPKERKEKEGKERKEEESFG